MGVELPAEYSKLTPSERAKVRQQYIDIQDGKCYWCGVLLSHGPPEYITVKKLDMRIFPDNFLRHPIHLQHNHDTDETEGAVHAYCNGVMWQYHNR